MTGLTPIRFADLEPTPWKNGLGVTRELFRAPTDPAGEFDIRVSIADVAASGPFSPYPGVDRIIMLLDGAGMRLRVGGEVVELHRAEPYRFDGAAAVVGEIDSPTRDLNVMVRRGRAHADLAVVCAGTVLDLGAPTTLAVAVPPDPLGLEVLGAAGDVRGALVLGPLDACVLPDQCRVRIGGLAAVVSITDAVGGRSIVPAAGDERLAEGVGGTQRSDDDRRAERHEREP